MASVQVGRIVKSASVPMLGLSGSLKPVRRSRVGIFNSELHSGLPGSHWESLRSADQGDWAAGTVWVSESVDKVFARANVMLAPFALRERTRSIRRQAPDYFDGALHGLPNGCSELAAFRIC